MDSQRRTDVVRVGKILIGLIMLAILLALVAFAVWNSEEKPTLILRDVDFSIVFIVKRRR